MQCMEFFRDTKWCTSQWKNDNVEPETKITSATKTIIHGLERFSNYSVQVLAFTRAGDGILSYSVYCNTMEDVPDAPSDIKALPLSSAAILIVWKPPLNKNGVISKYSVYMRAVETGKEETIKHVVLGSQTHYEFMGMEENVRYEFWVTASTSVGEGQSTHVISLVLTAPPVTARVASFDEQLVTSLGSDISLSCRAVGIPLPEREWKTKSHVVEKNERFQWMPDGMLVIKDIQNTDSGNYTCHVWNVHGSDLVTYAVMVQVPPTPPNVSLHEMSMDSMSLRWAPMLDGGLPILGYSLHYRREYGEWEEVSLTAEHLAYTLYNLECGTRYQVQVTARNKIGIGLASPTMSLQTEGKAPVVPHKEKLIEESATYITLHLDSWRDITACPTLYFVVENRLHDTNSWHMLSNNVQPQLHSQFIIPDLEPGTWYKLKMTAHNTAGSSVAEYDYATLTLSGVTLASEPSINGSSGTWDVRVVASVTCSTIMLTIVIAIICLLSRRSSNRISKKDPVRTEQYEKAATEPTTKSYVGNNSTSGSFTYLLGNNDRHHNQNVTEFEVKGHHTDICPYATFQLNETQRQENHAEELKTFSQRRNMEMEDVYAKVKKTTPLQRTKPHYAYPNIQDYANPEHEECNMEIQRTDQCLHLDRPLTNQYPEGLCDHVPDLLDHNPESASSNEQSPVLDKVTYLTDLGRNSTLGFVSLRHHRPNKSYYEATPDATLVYEDGMGVCIPYYKGQHPYLDTSDTKQEQRYQHQ